MQKQQQQQQQQQQQLEEFDYHSVWAFYIALLHYSRLVLLIYEQLY